MRIHLTIDDELVEQALELAEPGMKKADLFRDALKTFIRVKSGQRLIALGGSMPDIQDVPRRNSGFPINP